MHAASVAPRPVTKTVRLGVVSFLNTLPLIDGLDRLRGVQLCPSVPSLLLDQLIGGQVDLALCSSIDYQRSPLPLVIAPVGLLGCAGATLTVRLYARRPLDQLERVYCDTDSHTSVVLARILLRELYGVDPVLVDYDARESVADNRLLPWPEAMLLIGDKVVSASPPAVRYPIQLDLGEAWHGHTGLPFVFAIWMARREDPSLEALVTAAQVLDRQRRRNHLRLDRIIHRHAAGRGWPVDLARTYLKDRLLYECTPAAMEALALFYEKAHEHGLIDRHDHLEFLAV